MTGLGSAVGVLARGRRNSEGAAAGASRATLCRRGWRDAQEARSAVRLGAAIEPGGASWLLGRELGQRLRKQSEVAGHSNGVRLQMGGL